MPQNWQTIVSSSIAGCDDIRRENFCGQGGQHAQDECESDESAENPGSYYYAVNDFNTGLTYLKSYSQTHLLSKNVSKGATDYAASFTNITSLVQKTGTTKSIEFTGASTGYFVTSAPNTDGYGTVPQIVMACADINASDRVVTRLTSVSTDYYSNGTGTTASVTPKFHVQYL